MRSFHLVVARMFLIALPVLTVCPQAFAGGCAQPLFGDPALYEVDQYPHAIAAADLNGDGHLDLAVVNGFLYSKKGELSCLANWVSILLNNGDGAFTVQDPQELTSECPHAVAIADFDGDRDADFAVVCEWAFGVDIFLNSGSGTFPPPAFLDVGLFSYPHSVAVGDLDGDSDADIAVGRGEPGGVTVFLNDGDASFGSAVTFAMPTIWDSVRFLALADLNGDGHLDIAASSLDVAVVFFNNGDGTFGSATQLPGPDHSVKAIAPGDIDGDGDTDLALARNHKDAVVLLRNNGQGVFAVSDTITGFGPGGASFAAIHDLNGDGLNDLAVAVAGGSSNFAVLLSEGGAFAPPVPYDPGFGFTPAFVIGDFDLDGDPDVAAANAVTEPSQSPPNGTVGVLMNNCAAPLSPGDLDGDGDVDGFDLATLLASWGACKPSCPADLNGDGAVDGRDLALLLGEWGNK